MNNLILEAHVIKIKKNGYLSYVVKLIMFLNCAFIFGILLV